VFRSLARVLCLSGSLASLAALPLGAQEKSTKETKASSTVPQSAQPPAGMCRVWLENVPASQQPAPTDCATAIKNRPNNARLIFGNLKDEAAKAPQNAQKSSPPPSNQRTNGWPTRLTDPPRRFDTSPGIPPRSGDGRATDAGATGVRPVGSTTPVIRAPSPDSGRKRRPSSCGNRLSPPPRSRSVPSARPRRVRGLGRDAPPDRHRAHARGL
jgi:hypothetical protein